MEKNKLQINQNQQLTPLDAEVERIVQFLKDAGLPSDNIFASPQERKIVNNNLPDFIYNLPDEIKKDARYLAKCVIGAGFGLFDYSLNSIWNEVVLTLRQKAINYGLDIFFDNAVGGSMRDKYNNEDDLSELKDNTLLNTCFKLELISELTFKKLAHILDMRNDIGISHPTNHKIGGFELMAWIQVSVQEVIADQPSPAAIKVKQFIDNLKNYGKELDEIKIAEITPEINSLATHHCDSILRTLFGIYVAKDTDPILFKNISVLAPVIWPLSSDSIKDRIGITLTGFNNNLVRDKYEKGTQFFSLVKGNAHLPENDRVVPLDKLIKQLNRTHTSYDNYYNEADVSEQIMTYIEKEEDIPSQIAKDLITTFVMCRVGNGYAKFGGVSPKGKIYYDMLFTLIGSKYVPHVLASLTAPIITVRLDRNVYCRTACVELLTNLRKSIVNEKYLEAIDYLIKNIPLNGNAVISTEFKKITSTFIKWK